MDNVCGPWPTPKNREQTRIQLYPSGTRTTKTASSPHKYQRHIYRPIAQVSNLERISALSSTYVVVTPCLQRRRRAFFSSKVSGENCGSSFVSTLYFKMSKVRMAIPSVSKNLPWAASDMHQDGMTVYRPAPQASTSATAER